MQHEHDIAAESPVDEDDDLFGSPPPPSPVRGRSPSPGLALPNSSNGISLLSQNVGTIALPGSQHGSELAVNSLALPFSSALPGLLRPPAQITSSVVNDQCRLQAFGPRSNPSSTSSTPCSSRASSSAPTGTKPKKKGKAKSTASSRSSRPPPPVIPLPDPSKPLPPNWLRSQSALLGHAGLVGGIKPANLSLSTRGSTPSNPIVVDDSDAMAKVAQAREKPRRTQRIHYAAIDKMNLPAPSTKDIVDILLKQKEVLPVLQDLLKLVYKDAPFLNKSTAGGSQSSDSSAPPAAKKRRLNSVPAGAVDWDVPYPFQTGEGPQKYQDSWAHERVRELVLQLVALIKTASRKAALRNYIKEHQPELEKEQSERQAQSQQSLSERKELEHSEPKTHGHYKPITAFYGLDMPHHDNHAESSNSSTCSIPQPTPADPSNHTIGQVITTLLGPPPPDQSPQPAVLGDTAVADVTQPSAPLDDTDGWLSLLQSFPTLQNPSQGTPLDGVSGTSTPSLTDVPMEFGSWGCSNSEYMDVDLPLDFGSSFEFEHSSSTDTSALLDALFGPTETSTSGLDGLSLSIPQMMPSGPPSLVSSPMPSLSSMGDFPMTPTTPAGLEFGNGSDMAVGTVHDTEALDAASLLMALGNGNGSVSGQGKEAPKTSMSTSENQTRQGEDVEGTQPTPTNLEAQNQPSNLAQMEKKAVASVLPMLISALPTAVSVPSSSHAVPITQAIASLFEKAPYMQPASNTPTPSSSHSSQLPSKMFEREELLKVARERRRQLEEAVMKTRTQLWETTIEHGVMTHLLKYYNKESQ